MAKRLSIGSPLQIAEKLFKIRQEIAAFMEPIKALEEKEEKLRVEMLESLKANKMDALKTDRGVSYARASRAKLEITDPKKALDWALANNCAKVDTTKAASSLKGKGALPEGFEETFTDYLQVTGINKAIEENLPL